jgi:hypothetical protein
MKTIAKLLALALLMGSLAFAQDKKDDGAKKDDAKKSDTKKPKKEKKAKSKKKAEEKPAAAPADKK